MVSWPRQGHSETSSVLPADHVAADSNVYPTLKGYSVNHEHLFRLDRFDKKRQLRLEPDQVFGLEADYLQ